MDWVLLTSVYPARLGPNGPKVTLVGSIVDNHVERKTIFVSTRARRSRRISRTAFLIRFVKRRLLSIRASGACDSGAYTGSFRKIV